MKKSKVDKDLWLYNDSGNDVSISDLGVKVPAGQSISVYKTNPYLTEEQVEKSMKYGALLKRLSGEKPTLKIIQKKIGGRKVIDKIKESKEPIKAIKTKSAIFIEQKSAEEIQDNSGFDFADYGVDSSVVSSVKEGVGFVVKAKEDEVKQEQPISDLEPTIKQSNQGQSLIVMEKQKEAASNPMGKMVEIEAPTNSFVVEKIKKAAIEEIKTITKKIKEPVKIARTESVTSEAKIEMVEVKPQEMVAVKKDAGVVIENKSDLDFLDSLPTKEKVEKKEGGMRVASRTKDGVVVMKIKE